MEYDVASKVILSHCRLELLRELCGFDVVSSEILDDRPQETPSLRRSDYVLRAEFQDGITRLVILEFQTWWKHCLPVRTLESRCRHLQKEKLPVVSVIIVLRKHGPIPGYYEDDEVKYRYRLVEMYDMDAHDMPCLSQESPASIRLSRS